MTIAERPTALQNDADKPEDAKWGPVIASKSASLFLIRNREVADGPVAVTEEYMGSVESDQIKRLLGQEVQRSN